MDKYLEGKTKQELKRIILANEATKKAVRNAMIKDKFASYSVKIPMMDRYTDLSVTYGMSEQMVMHIVKS